MSSLQLETEIEPLNKNTTRLTASASSLQKVNDYSSDEDGDENIAEAKKESEFDRMDHISEIDKFVKHPETWQYAADKPTNREYNKLGKDFGKMLIERGYQWKTYYQRFFEVLSLAFPTVRTDKFEHYYEDFRFIRQNLEKVRWEWDHVKSLQQVSFMGEGCHVLS